MLPPAYQPPAQPALGHSWSLHHPLPGPASLHVGLRLKEREAAVCSAPASLREGQEPRPLQAIIL